MLLLSRKSLDELLYKLRMMMRKDKGPLSMPSPSKEFIEYLDKVFKKEGGDALLSTCATGALTVKMFSTGNSIVRLTSGCAKHQGALKRLSPLGAGSRQKRRDSMISSLMT